MAVTKTWVLRTAVIGGAAALVAGAVSLQKLSAQSAAPAQALPATAQTPGAAPKSGAPAPGAGAGATGQQLPNVTTSKPVVKPIVEWDEYTGRFDAVETVEVRARVSGYLNEVHFKDGQLVKKGDLLYSIDPRPFERAHEQAKAELAQASTKAENTTLDVERGRPLVERKVMSEKVFDDRANALREAQALVKVADAKVKTAELDLFFTKITSPISGRISRSNMVAGAWVSAGAAANAALLTTIVSQDPIHLYFDISENNWIKYRRMIEAGTKKGAAQIGSEVQLALPDETGYPVKGKVDFVDNRLDQATGTMRARAIVDNKVGRYSAGMFARVRVQGSDEYSAVMIPDEAIGTDQTNKFVYVVAEDGTVARKAVTLGPIVDNLRVVRTGVTADDWVITKGIQRARPGAKVAAKREEIKVGNAPAQGAKTQ